MRVKLKNGGTVQSTSENPISISHISTQVREMATTGKISNREANRILKGLRQVEAATEQGVTYTLTGNNTFTAQKEGVDINGKASGLNVTGNFLERNLEGRKVSRALGFIQAVGEKPKDTPPTLAPAADTGSGTGGASNPFLPPKSLEVHPFALNTNTYTNPVTNFSEFLKKATSGGEKAEAAPANPEKPETGHPAPAATKKASVSLKTPASKPAAVQKPAGKQPTGPVKTPGQKTGVPSFRSVPNLPSIQTTIPVLDLTTQEDVKKQTLQPAVQKPVQKTVPVPGKSTVKLVAKPLQAPKEEPGFFETLQNWTNQSLNRQGQELQQRDQKRQAALHAQRRSDIERQLGSKIMQQNIAYGLDYMKKYPQLKSYRFFVEDGIFSDRNYFVLTPDGRVVSEYDPSVTTSSFAPVQKKEGGDVLFRLGANLVIDPKKRFVLPINPVGINTSYTMPTLSIPASGTPPIVGTGKKQRVIEPDFKIPLAKQTTLADTSQSGSEANLLRLVNAGLGVAGTMSYATAKRPVVPGPIKFQSATIPVTGLTEASKRGAQNQIAQQTLQAAQMANTSDNRYNTAVKLQANYNANQALSNLAAQDSEVYQQNLKQSVDQKNQDAFINMQNEQAYQQQKFETDSQAYQQRRDMGTQMAQSALTYEVQRNADLQNKRTLENQTNQQLGMMAEQAIIQANTSRIVAGQPVLTPDEENAIRQKYRQYATQNYIRLR